MYRRHQKQAKYLPSADIICGCPPRYTLHCATLTLALTLTLNLNLNLLS